MNPLDDLPQRHNSHDTGEAAETAFRNAVNNLNYFVIQREDRNDYGTDIQIEARKGDAMTNIRVHVQLKGTESTTNKDDSVSISVERTNLNYLLAQPNSVYVCYHLPSKRLLVRYAEDVYREYEHRGGAWMQQSNLTVRFFQPFDEHFQQQLNARVIASGTAGRDRRLLWTGTPPDKLSALVQRSNEVIEVPVDEEQALKVLEELYEVGKDSTISNCFDQFAAVLGSVPHGMLFAYLAEINLGINAIPFDRDRIIEGVKFLDEMIEKQEGHPGSIFYCIGNAGLALGNYEMAQAAYYNALKLLRVTPETYELAARCCKNWGSVLKKISRMHEARNAYEGALKFDPDLGEAHLALGLWHRQHGNISLALKHLDNVIQQSNSAVQMSTVHGWRMTLFFESGDTEGAFREINNLIGEAKQHEWIWPCCARHVAQFGVTSADSARKALIFWRQYLREHPKYSRAERERLLCNWYLHSRGAPCEIDFQGFKTAVVQLIENGDSSPAFLWDRIGHFAQDDGDWEEAEQAYRKAYQIEPERYGYCLGTALNLLRRYSEALPILLPQAEQHLPDAMSWFQVAQARGGVGDIEGCISAYEKAIELDDSYDLAWFNLGGVYWNNRQTEKAGEIWREAVRRFPNHEIAKKLLQDLLSRSA
ncbi:MAG: Tetratricopeptide repeat-containing protein [Candidatus Electronema aureum]|uniref:Tetratricopeptide repeat-containing protein n=1 Tax=Candidatus Electronema aureum TaxID=2005002 RepID=A0A521G085_9BACT|nr:MAG: Tetratricopeptide repeat-containing protein [Candidatus Electronema aureum]